MHLDADADVDAETLMLAYKLENIHIRAHTQHGLW